MRRSRTRDMRNTLFAEICDCVTGGWQALTEYTNKVEKFNVKMNRWDKVSNMIERRNKPGKCASFFIFPARVMELEL